MGSKTGVAASRTLTKRVQFMPLAGERHDHAALALGVGSTLVYVMSALVAYFVSYTQGGGREKLTLMLVGLLLPLALAVLVRRRVETTLGMLGVVLALTCALLGAAVLLMPGINQGAAAGSVAVVLPLAGCAIVWALARRNSRLLWGLAATIGIAAGCVFLSGERSAILGLVVGVLFSGGLFWRLRLAEPSPWLRVIDLSTLVLVVLSLGVYLALILAPEQMGWLGAMLPGYYAQRFALWRDTPAIIQDYLYTGSGLGASPMVLSTYLFLIHVPYYYHIHNLFLQVAIEQGAPGVIGLTGMFAAGVWSMTIAMRRGHAYLALCAAMVLGSLLALFVSGLFESDVYAGSWIVSMFLPFGFAWLLGQHDASLHASRMRVSSRVHAGDLAVGLLPVLTLAALIVWPGSDVRWMVNQAALAQTRIELSHFRFPLNKIQDELRRNGEFNLEPAIHLYRAALERNPTNASALRRLAQIEISRGAYASAQHNLETAYQVAPEQRATRQMLGEIYAIGGDTARALALWGTVENGAGQLAARRWWHEYIGENDAAQRMADVMTQLDAAAGR